MYGEKLFRGTRKRFLREINAFSPSFLSQMDLGNVDMWNMSVFLRITVKYVTKSTDKLRCLRQPRSQGLSSYRPLERAKRDPGWVWSRATLTIKNIREGSSVISNLSR